MKSNKAVKAVKAGKASAAALKLVPKTPETGIMAAIAQTFPQGKQPESVATWSKLDLTECYVAFTRDFKSAHGQVTRLARAVLSGAVAADLLVTLWDERKKEDTAKQFIAALKEAMRVAQKNPDTGKLPEGYTTVNVGKDEVLRVEAAKGRNTDQQKKLGTMVKKVARLVKELNLTENQRELFKRRFAEAIDNPQGVLDAA